MPVPGKTAVVKYLLSTAVYMKHITTLLQEFAVSFVTQFNHCNIYKVLHRVKLEYLKYWIFCMNLPRRCFA